MQTPRQIKQRPLPSVKHHLVYGFNLSEKQATESKPEPSQHTYLDTKVTTEQRLKKTQQTSASERLRKKQESKEKIISLLKKVGEIDLSERLEICGQKWSTITCGQHVISRRPNHRCSFRLCPFCASRRSQKIQMKYLPVLNEFLRAGKRSTAVHLVLTQAHRKSETLKESRKRLISSFKKLQRREFWRNHFYGGIYAFEATITESKWHSHLHILAFRRRFFDISLLRREWREITGDSVVLRLDRITDVKTGLREVVKYISKPLDVERISPKLLREILELKGCRMFGAFGLFANFCRKFDASDIEKSDAEIYSGYCEGDACPLCQKPLFELVLPVESLIGFMRKIEAVPRC